MNKKILIISGPPAAGKSSVADEITKQMKKAAHIQVEQLRHMIKGEVPLHSHLDKSVDEQFEIARENAVDIAKNMCEDNYFVIIDDIVRQHWVQNWKDHFKDYDLKFVLLLPHINVVKERNRNRSLKEDESVIEVLYEIFADENTQDDTWIVIDSSDHTVRQTADYILENVI